MTKFKELLRELAENSKKEFERISESGGHKENLSESSEVVTEMDRRMTELVIEFFERRPEGFSFASEELKKDSNHQSGEDSSYTVIFDEIDGTGNMKDDRGSFGPIIGIANQNNPKFEDIIACMFYDLKTDTLYEAYKREGAYQNGKRIETGNEEELREAETRLIVDQVMLGENPEIAQTLWKYYPKNYGSQGFHFALIASDRADMFITGGHGYLEKNNTAEEIGPLYLLIKESGGSVIDWKGNRIGKNRIGLEEEKNHDIIAASSNVLAQNLAKQIDITS